MQKLITLACLAIIAAGCKGDVARQADSPGSPVKFTDGGERFELELTKAEAARAAAVLTEFIKKNRAKLQGTDDTLTCDIRAKKATVTLRLTLDQAVQIRDGLIAQGGAVGGPGKGSSTSGKKGDLSFGSGGTGISTGNGFQYNLKDGSIGPSWGP